MDAVRHRGARTMVISDAPHQVGAPFRRERLSQVIAMSDRRLGRPYPCKTVEDVCARGGEVGQTARQRCETEFLARDLRHRVEGGKPLAELVPLTPDLVVQD